MSILKINEQVIVHEFTYNLDIVYKILKKFSQHKLQAISKIY